MDTGNTGLECGKQGEKQWTEASTIYGMSFNMQRELRQWNERSNKVLRGDR